MNWKIENSEIQEYLNDETNKVPRKLRFLAGLSLFIGRPIAYFVTPGLTLSFFSVFLGKKSIVNSIIFYILCLLVFMLLLSAIYELIKKFKDKKIDLHATLNCIGLAASYLGLGVVYY